MNRLRSAFCVALLLAGLPALAADRHVLAGGEVSRDAFHAYSGIVVPLTDPATGRGFVQRYWVDRYGYDYAGSGNVVTARAWGAEAALGYGASSASGWAAVSVGLRYTDTSLSPDDPQARARGGQFGARLQLEGEREMRPGWRVSAIAAASSRSDEYWARLRSMHRAAEALAIGAEFVAGGNADYRARSAGIVLALRPAASGWSVALKAGGRRERGETGGYAGLEFGLGL